MRLHLVAVIVVLAALLVSCAAPVVAPTPTASAPAALSATDDRGQTVALAQPAQRVVSLLPSATEILFAVGAGDQVVGVTQYCNYPPEAAQGREIIGGFSPDTISVEKIVALQPDLVIADARLQQPTIAALEQAGITVVAFNPQGFDGVYANILLVGQLTGHADEAAAVVSQMKERIAAVEQAVADVAPEARPRVFFEVWDEPLMTAGPTTFTGQMIEKAGGVNLFADLQEEYPQISAEAVLERDPDFILGPDTHGEALTPERITARPGWSGLKAVKNGHIAVIDGDISSRPGPRIADAVEIIARILYPDRFPAASQP